MGKSISMPQDKKILNRVFAIAFALIILTYLITDFLLRGRSSMLMSDIHTLIGGTIIIIAYSVIVIGLLIEAWKPSLDFTFHRNWKWIFASIILFAVFILINAWWWIAHGPGWLSQHGLQAAIIEYIVGVFIMETSSLSLLFGILFLTKSIPQKSPSYKTMLIGAVLLEFMFFLTYITAIAGGAGVPEQHKDFFGFTIFQPWFWLDFTAEIVIFVGAIWLLVKGKVDSTHN